MGPADRLIRTVLQEAPAPLTGDSPWRDVLILNAGDGGLGTEVRVLRGNAQITLFERDARTSDASRARAGLTVSDRVEPLAADSADLALLIVPKGRALARRQLMGIHQALRVGGRLVICGPSSSGAKGVISDAKVIFGNAEVVAYKEHQRAAISIRTEQPIDGENKLVRKWYGKAGIMPGTQCAVVVPIDGQDVTFKTEAGAFSWEHLDPGTALLLEHMAITAGETVCDVGCGWGVIGVAAALRGAGRVWMTDVDRGSVALSEQNAEAAGVADRCIIRAADNLTWPPAGEDAEASGTPDLIVSNPPFHQGNKVDNSMARILAERAAATLKPGGRLLVVCNRFLPYHRLLKDVFGTMPTIVVEDSAYRVVEVVKPEPQRAVKVNDAALEDEHAGLPEGVVDMSPEEFDASFGDPFDDQ